ncbi:MAG: hypothetical protein H6912_03245 [Kordiimonadaceae bacterium]|nr:hypothetical protein [Kordiimonadaceae bacterium]
MGGLGTGFRFTKKALVEDFPRIDILELHREGKVSSLSYGYYADKRNNISHEEFDYYGNDETFWEPYDEMIFVHKQVDQNFNTTFYENRTIVEWFPCRFGGKRPYFICPTKDCAKCVQHLYLKHNSLICRHCLKLGYETQRIPDYARVLKRLHKAAARGGIKNLWYEQKQPGGAKFNFPKGMHYETRLKIVTDVHREMENLNCCQPSQSVRKFATRCN